MALADALLHLDRFTNEADFLKLKPDDITRAILAYSQTHAPSSIRTTMLCWRTYYTWKHDGDLPKAWHQVLRRPRTRLLKEIKPLSDDEFQKLLKATTLDHRFEAPARVARRVCLVWLLWDTGFRISELLGLRVGSIEFDERGGAHLSIPPDAPDLKSGPRTVYVVECVGSLRAWLALHPFSDIPDAPLFPGSNDNRVPTTPSAALQVLYQLSERAGIRRVHPHLFRHTRATRAAAAGWNEAQLRGYFGWNADSEMASHYVHLAQGDIDARVRQDANVDPLGNLIREDPKAALAETFKLALDAADKRRGGDAAPAPVPAAPPPPPPPAPAEAEQVTPRKAVAVSGYSATYSFTIE